MNGRVYLPEIGRFLSPDPFVQFPESTQNYNRYTYVGNNPLSYTDPSGYFLMALFKAAMFIYNGVQGYKAGGIGGMMKGFLISGISAGLSNAIGDFYGKLAAANGEAVSALANKTIAPFLTGGQFAAKVFTHGVVQGSLSRAGGGRFGDGFLGGGASSVAGPWLEKLGQGPGQAMVAAMIGGTVSKLGGGRFANGAISAAFVNMFNDQTEHPEATTRDKESGPTSDRSDETTNHQPKERRVEVTAPNGQRISVDPNYATKVIWARMTGADPNAFDADSLCVTKCAVKYAIFGEVSAHGLRAGLETAAEMTQWDLPNASRHLGAAARLVAPISVVYGLATFTSTIRECAVKCGSGN